MACTALRESGSGLATLPEGSDAGLRRFIRGELVAAGNPLSLAGPGDVLTSRVRVAVRPEGAGPDLLLRALLHQMGRGPMQTFLRFLRSPLIQGRAQELGGYDLS